MVFKAKRSARKNKEDIRATVLCKMSDESQYLNCLVGVFADYTIRYDRCKRW